MELKDKTCLVTGASGFIGALLCCELKKQKANVKALIRSDLTGIWDDSFICELGASVIPENLMEGVDVIFHLAGRAHSVADSESQDLLYFKTNVEGTKSLLESAEKAGVKKFIYFSSVKSMGEESDIRLDESSRSEPTTAYGKSKKEAEELVLHGNYIEYPTVLRLPMVYGESSKGNLPRMIKAISANKFPPLPRVVNKRSMIHVEDVVQAAVIVATNLLSAGQVYILSDGLDYSTREIYESICRSLGKKPRDWGVPLSLLSLIAKFGDLAGLTLGRRIIFDSDSLQKLVGSSYFSSEKINNQLGFVAKQNLYNLMPEMVFYAENNATNIK